MDRAQPVRPNGGLVVALVGDAVLAVLVLALFALLAFYVPGAKKTFDEFGMTLPWATQATVRVSHWVCEYWWCAALVLGPVAAGNFVLLYLLGRRGRVLPALVTAGEVLLVGALIALVLVSILLPMAKLHEGLAR